MLKTEQVKKAPFPRDLSYQAGIDTLLHLCKPAPELDCNAADDSITWLEGATCRLLGGIGFWQFV